MGFPRQEYRSGLSFPSPGDLPDPGIKPANPGLADGVFATETPGKPILGNKKEQVTGTGNNNVDESQKCWIRHRRQRTVLHHLYDILANTKYRDRKQASDCHGLGAG